jgi:hypothetical protein
LHPKNGQLISFRVGLLRGMAAQVAGPSYFWVEIVLGLLAFGGKPLFSFSYSLFAHG